MLQRAREDGRVLERSVAPPGIRLRFTSVWHPDKTLKASLGTNGEIATTVQRNLSWKYFFAYQLTSGYYAFFYFFYFSRSVSSSVNKILIESGFAFIVTLTAVSSLQKIWWRPPAFKGTSPSPCLIHQQDPSGAKSRRWDEAHRRDISPDLCCLATNSRRSIGCMVLCGQVHICIAALSPDVLRLWVV